MLEPSPSPHRPRISTRPPFPRILCALDEGAGTDEAIEQAIAVAGPDARIVFAANWYGRGSAERAAEADAHARAAVEAAVERAEAAGVEARAELFHGPRLVDALLRAAASHDLVVVGAHSHARITGIVLGELATQLVHTSPIPVLVAREPQLATGLVAATRAWPRDRIALTKATHIAARLGAELTVVHVHEPDDFKRQPELDAELANVRALLGRQIDHYLATGPAARAIVDVAEGDGAGLVVVGSDQRRGLSALASVSERVAHLAPCSVLVMRAT
ncbi:MAG TPA: universal stress protein [Solirubrobacter sp.]|nr:universal stress protein [Solirubrobacter sp.]